MKYTQGALSFAFFALFLCFSGSQALAQTVSEEVTDIPVEQEGEKVVEETVKPLITVEAEIIGGDLDVTQLRFTRTYCVSDTEEEKESVFQILKGNTVTVEACYQEEIENGVFQPVTPINYYFFDYAKYVSEGDGDVDTYGYELEVSGENCDASATYEVAEATVVEPVQNAHCIFTFTYDEQRAEQERAQAEQEEELEEEEVNNEEKEIAEVAQEAEGELASVDQIGAGYTINATINELNATQKSVPVEKGDIVNIEMDITNDAGLEDLVLYLFVAKVDDPTNALDEGVFTTDHYFVDQKILVGESKTYSFSWLNDEQEGVYRFFAEIKRVDWSGAPLQKQQVGFVEVVESLEPQALGAKTYRFWSDNYKGHFYTTSQAEADNIIANNPNWTYEGAGDKTVNVDNITSDNLSALTVLPVYRFWSEGYNHHFYTNSEQEKEYLQENDPNWQYEQIAYYAYRSQQMDTTAVYRFWSDNYKGHFYTSSQEEKESIEQNDKNWIYEGIAWYVQK